MQVNLTVNGQQQTVQAEPRRTPLELASAFALVSCAVVLRLEGRRIYHARVVLGGVSARPWRAAAAAAA